MAYGSGGLEPPRVFYRTLVTRSVETIVSVCRILLSGRDRLLSRFSL